MYLTLRVVAVLAAASALLIPAATTEAEARGTRVSAAAKRSLPARTVTRARPRTAARVVATRVVAAPVRPVVSVRRSTGIGTRVAGFVQRAPLGATSRSFVNGYSDLSFMQFSTGDFFEGQQRLNGGQ